VVRLLGVVRVALLSFGQLMISPLYSMMRSPRAIGFNANTPLP
jgi:hypothetical protein